jgi:hypothetical protein
MSRNLVDYEVIHEVHGLRTDTISTPAPNGTMAAGVSLSQVSARRMTGTSRRAGRVM